MNINIIIGILFVTMGLFQICWGIDSNIEKTKLEIMNEHINLLKILAGDKSNG